MKKVLALVLALAMILGLGAMSVMAEEAAPDYGQYTPENPLKLTVSQFGPNDINQLYTLARCFGDIVEEKTNGAVQVEVLIGGVSDKDSLEQVIFGTLDMAVNNTPIMSQFYDKFQVLDLPYLFENYDQIYAFLESDVCQKLMAEFGEKTGARMLCMRAVGYRNLESQKGFMHGVEDISNIKTRCTNSVAYTKTWEAWGANVQTLSGGEVMAALQQGTIDSCDNVNNTALSEGYYQVANYITVMEYAAHFNGLTINEALYQSFTPDLQAAISEAAVEASVIETKARQESAEPDLQKMCDSEYNVTAYVMTAEERAALREAAQPVYDWFVEKFGSEDLEAIVALGK